jgi:hypothetical protein
MNEIIAKLTEQCYEYNETMHGTWFNKTKFAELIINECASLAEDGFFDDLDGQEICDGIKNHFGV